MRYLRSYSFANASLMYATLLEDIAEHGSKTEPRGLPTRELRNVILRLEDPRLSWLDIKIRPGYCPAIGLAEGLQLVAGLSLPDLMVKISPGFVKFREDNGSFHGAYGPRLSGQLRQVVQKLSADPDTRQAVATIWRPVMDGYPDAMAKKDVPCTIDLVFAVRDSTLILDTHMRSNDAWLGLPYDLLQFTVLQTTVANVLGMAAGPYTHYVNSLHIYDTDLEKVVKLISYIPTETPAIRGINAVSWDKAERDAQLFLTDRVVPPADNFLRLCRRFIYEFIERRDDDQA